MLEPHLRRNSPRKIGGDGDIEIFCADEQSDVAVDVARWHSLAKNILVSEGVRGAVELTLMFVPESTISHLNEKYMGKSGPTDVLSFPLDAFESMRSPGPGATSQGPNAKTVDLNDLPILLGDVVICPAVAMKQALSHAGTHDDEMALLLVHGILHVLGNDHDTPDAANAMQALERKHLEAFHWGGTAPANFRHVPEITQ